MSMWGGLEQVHLGTVRRPPHDPQPCLQVCSLQPMFCVPVHIMWGLQKAHQCLLAHAMLVGNGTAGLYYNGRAHA